MEKKAGIPTTGSLPLLIHAALSHPSCKVREKLWIKLDALLDNSFPKHKATEVEKVLLSFKGTVLEPFYLDKNNLRAAVFLTRLAFSQKEKQSRIRINSQLNPLDQGGLVLTHNLKSYFIERLKSAKYTRSPKCHWVFNPGREPIQTDLPPRLNAKGWIGDHGYEACIELKDFGVEEWNYSNINISSLIQHSYLRDSRKSLLDLGVDAWKRRNRLHLAMARPELMIQYGPKISSKEGLWFFLNQHDESENASGVSLHMGFSEEDPKPLTARVVLGQTDLGGWIYSDCEFTPQLEENLNQALLDWCPIIQEDKNLYPEKLAA
jgi:hypothetical protein